MTLWHHHAAWCASIGLKQRHMAVTPVVSCVQVRQGLQDVPLAQRLSVWMTEDGLMGQPRLHIAFL